jgi:hypothetical protein
MHLGDAHLRGVHLRVANLRACISEGYIQRGTFRGVGMHFLIPGYGNRWSSYDNILTKGN